MGQAALKLPGEAGFDQTAFNRARWDEVLQDEFLASLAYRIETDRFGQIVMSTPPAPDHGGKQFEVGYLLRKLMQNGKVITECPISTSDGVKGCDTVWISENLRASMEGQSCFSTAPEICVKVISLSNSKAEIEHKVALYFEAGAKEVWECDESGEMKFHIGKPGAPVSQPEFCPAFPSQIDA
ncbi:MAG: Uma2 family endonuclease [Verrucomicrobiota bacterium]